MRGAFASLALAAAGAIAAWAANPVGPSWTANPDEQFLLDVNIRQLRLGDGVRAYQTPEGTCVVFGDFLTTLDVPIKIDLQARKAVGWAFNEENRIEIDQVAGLARFGKQQEKLSPGAIRETPEGWCIDSAALGRWFGIGVTPRTEDRFFSSNQRRSCRSSWRASANSALPGSTRPRYRWRACRRSNCPTECGAPRRSISSSALA
jgi:hypothetical protein